MANLLDPRLTNGIAIVVTVLWVVNFGARLFIAEWEPSVAVDVAMTSVLGAALGYNFIRKNNR